MSDFDFTTLEDGEEIVFGVTTASSSSAHRHVENGVVTENSSVSSERKIGVTNRRAIVETVGDSTATRIVPNDQVSRVQLQRSDFMGKPRFNLAAVETATGESLALGIGFLEAKDKARLCATFPHAEIVESGDAPEEAQADSDAPRKKGIFG